MEDLNTQQKQFDFIERINSELLQRMDSNDRYSLRAFARDISMDPSNLSKILRRKKEINLNQLRYIAKQLNISDSELGSYIEFRSPNGSFFTPYTAVETEKQLDHCSYLALLELSSLEGFTDDANWLATKLGVDPKEATSMISELIDMGYLVRDDQGKVSEPGGTNHHQSARFSSKATKIKMHNSFIDQSKEVLNSLALDKSAFSTMTLCFDKTRVLEVKDYLRKVTQDFDDKFNSKSEGNEVFNLNLSFFPMNASTPEESENDS